MTIDSSVPTSRGRRAFRFLCMVPTFLCLVALTITLTAQLIGDRTLWLALLMYVPILPIAGAAALWDLLLRGRALRRRWWLLALGLMAGGFSIAQSWSPARAPEGEPLQPSITLVQWNTQWGGRHGQASLSNIVDTLEAQHADVVCLSEAPVQAELQRELLQRGASLHSATLENVDSGHYWYRFTLLSKWPVTMRKEWRLRTGHAVLFELARVPRPLRILMVDLESPPKIPRSETLVEAAQWVADFAEAGEPIDLVVGDFNTPGRFLGFDALAAAGEGYRRAAMWSGQWRGTWPSRLPLPPFDIDHVWVRAGLNIASSKFFTDRVSDHRGQVAVVRLP